MTDESPALVGVVVVSHSSELAEATVVLVSQLANIGDDGPRLVAAGGLADGALGTDAVRIADAIGHADAGSGVVIVADLGSAVLSAATAIDELLSSGGRRADRHLQRTTRRRGLRGGRPGIGR